MSPTTSFDRKTRENKVAKLVEIQDAFNSKIEEVLGLKTDKSKNDLDSLVDKKQDFQNQKIV